MTRGYLEVLVTKAGINTQAGETYARLQIIKLFLKDSAEGEV